MALKNMQNWINLSLFSVKSVILAFYVIIFHYLGKYCLIYDTNVFGHKVTLIVGKACSLIQSRFFMRPSTLTFSGLGMSSLFC